MQPTLRLRLRAADAPPLGRLFCIDHLCFAGDKMEFQVDDVLHPRIIDTCLSLHEDGHYQHAALESMKQVEMALREKGIAPKDLFGVHLVKWVMGSGEHITLTVPLGEDFQEKARTLFNWTLSIL